MDTKRSVSESLAKFLPCDVASDLLKELREVTLVLRVDVAGEVLALRLHDDHGGGGPAFGALLNHKVGVHAITPVALDREAVPSDRVAIPPEHLGVFVDAQRNLALVLVELLGSRPLEERLRDLAVVVVREAVCAAELDLRRKLEAALDALKVEGDALPDHEIPEYMLGLDVLLGIDESDKPLAQGVLRKPHATPDCGLSLYDVVYCAVDDHSEGAEAKPPLRPIVLVQVERTGKDQQGRGFVHAEDVKKHLMARLGVAEAEIAIKSSKQDDIEGIDLLDEGCPITWIITKSALQEGWDCPYAYILVSLSNTGSARAMTQLVGRVLRQPFTSRFSSLGSMLACEGGHDDRA